MTMATAIPGANKIMFVGEEVTSDTGVLKGARVSLQTTHTITESADSDSTTTKDGSVSSAAAPTTEMSIENLMSEDQTNAYLKASLEKQKTLPFWEVDFTKPVTDGENKDKYPARYMQGRVTKIEWGADADDNATQQADVSIDGVPVDGYVTVDKAVTAALQYAFRDLDTSTTTADSKENEAPETETPAAEGTE